MSTQGHGIRIGQLEIYAEERSEGSPASVFIHYWGGSRRTWSAVIERLRHRSRCIAVDLRGWGKSGRQADDYSLFAQADDVKGVIEALKVKDFVLVGHSMGGKIAQILAGQRPEGLRAVVLVAPAPPTPLHARDVQKRSMLASYRTPEGIGDALKVINHRPLTFARRLQVTEDSLGGAEAAKIAWISQGMALDISHQTASINVPVGVIVGSADQVEKEPPCAPRCCRWSRALSSRPSMGWGTFRPLSRPTRLPKQFPVSLRPQIRREPATACNGLSNQIGALWRYLMLRVEPPSRVRAIHLEPMVVTAGTKQAEIVQKGRKTRLPYQLPIGKASAFWVISGQIKML
jgi:3-oxoadipate enol-lactonase